MDYQKRAHELLLKYTDEFLTTSMSPIMDTKIVDAMCQLAEEVKTDTMKMCATANIDMLLQQRRDLYSEEQVKEFLQNKSESYLKGYEQHKKDLKNKIPLISTLVEEMGEKNNRIDLDAYAKGLTDMYNELIN